MIVPSIPKLTTPNVLAHLRDADPILRRIVNLARAGLSVPLTLLVAGKTVCGHVITEDAYLIEVAEHFRTSSVVVKKAGALLRKGDDAMEPISDQFSVFAGDATKRDESDVRFIHLRGVVIDGVVVASTENQPASHLWRGKLSAVDGFIINASV